MLINALSILSLFLRISEVCCLLTSYSVDRLVPFSNYKITDFSSSTERKDRLRFEVMMNSSLVTQKLARVPQTMREMHQL